VSHKKINDATIHIIAEHIRRIVRHHYPNRGIILSTYSMMKALKEALFEEHFVIHDVDGRKESIQLFKDSREYKIPILAASYEGLDFKDDIARFCIIPKVPFASLADASVKRTADRNMEQYIMDALTLIVQGSARVSRTETDYGVTYILDQSFMRVFEQYKHNLPLYFNEAVCHVGNLEDAFLNERVLVKNLKEGFYANKRL
jgi:Rad3-related DNA helicase